ncbi:hypothetical protein KDA11_04515 [Candidatus Saccharibacteria bacterium]|nr:hypothetical protein [Candidatus Saccharibacteria bacterium]
MEQGLGVESFDCSGLVIRSVCDVLGKKVDEWPIGLRHVRDMWNASNDGDLSGLASADISVGMLAVTGKHLTIDGYRQYVPGHIGVVTSVVDNCIEFIHASAPNKVTEGAVKNTARLIGGISILDADRLFDL